MKKQVMPRYLSYTSSAKPGYWYREHFMAKWNGSWNNENKVVETYDDGSFSTEFHKVDRFVEYMYQSRQVLISRQNILFNVLDKMDSQKYKHEYKGFMNKISLYRSWLKNIKSALARIDKCKIGEICISTTVSYSHTTEVSDEELMDRNMERYKAGRTTHAERFPDNKFSMTKIERLFPVSENDIYREFGLYPDGCKTEKAFNKYEESK